MSLQVWLPLNGTLDNQGLSSVTVTNNGATVDNNGKIGKCYYFTPNQWIKISLPAEMTTIKNTTIAAWVKSHSTTMALGGISHDGAATLAGVTLYSSGWQLSGGGNWKYVNGGTVANTQVWHHVACTIGDDEIITYLDGTKITSSTLTAQTVTNTSLTSTDNFIEIGCDHPGGDEYFTGYVNDFRIYDHALSAKEVKELAKGLVLHYKLDKINGGNANLLVNTKNMVSITTGNNTCAWASSGGIVDGESKISATTGWTNTSYGARLKLSEMQGKTYTFSVDVKAGTSGATYVPLLEIRNATINSASRKAKYRTFSMKLVSNNTSVAPTTDYQRYYYTFTLTTDIFTAQDSGNTGVVDWANDYLGLNIHNHNNYDYYTKNWKLEEGSVPTPWCPNSVDSEYLALGYGTEYDCSGYEHNGAITGELTNSSDTPRYNASTHINATNQKIHASGLTTSGFGNSYSFSWWAKCSTWSNMMHWGFSDGIRLNGIYNGTLWNTGDGSNNPLYSIGTTTQVTAPSINVWHHFVMTGNGTKCYVYLDGVLWAEAKTYKSISGTNLWINGWSNTTDYSNTNLDISDFRIYATALSADDVKELYHTAASIDNHGNVHAYELEEV